MKKRFTLLVSSLGVCLLAALSLGQSGCGGDSSGPAASHGGATGAKGAHDLTVGFIYVGPKDDYGYNQAHAQGAAAVEKMPGVKVLELENVPEDVKVQQSMKAMIEQDGATIVFPTSFGYFSPHILTVAKEYPNVTFLHCGGLYDASKHPENVGSYFGYIDECQYLSGIVAGHMTKSKKLGFVAAKPIPQVLRNVNAFTLGARSVNPAVTCQVIFTGEWSMPSKEGEATNSLIDQGVDVITCHVDSPKIVIQTAEKRGIYTCGYHCSQAVLAPKGYLTGAEWNWEKVYTDYLKELQAGKKLEKHLVRGGLKEGIVKTSPYGSMVTDEAKKAADDVKGKLLAGTFVIFKGPLKDNTGKEIIPAGKEYGQTAIELESMNYLVEGVIGTK
jgi:simple sugar transport system substrate-binding protein